jgi:hypothetical protein
MAGTSKCPVEMGLPAGPVAAILFQRDVRGKVSCVVAIAAGGRAQRRDFNQRSIREALAHAANDPKQTSEVRPHLNRLPADELTEGGVELLSSWC